MKLIAITAIGLAAGTVPVGGEFDHTDLPHENSLHHLVKSNAVSFADEDDRLAYEDGDFEPYPPQSRIEARAFPFSPGGPNPEADNLRLALETAQGDLTAETERSKNLEEEVDRLKTFEENETTLSNNLREADKKIEDLTTQVKALEDKVALVSTEENERATALIQELDKFRAIDANLTDADRKKVQERIAKAQATA